MESISLKRLDAVQKETTLKNGNHTLGRGPLLRCTDTRVSRKHATLGISDDGEITLTSLHDNPCFYKQENDPDFQVLKKNETVKLYLGDEFQLSPNSYCYRIEQGGFLADDGKEQPVDAESTDKGRYELSTQDIDKNEENHEEVKNGGESKHNEKEAEGRQLPGWMLAAEENGKKSPEKRQTKADEHPRAKKAKQDTEVAETTRRPCRYGDKCYRQNPAHKEEFSHPGDSDWQDLETAAASNEAAADLPECPYGTSCYRRNPKHRSEYKHTQPPENEAKPAASQKKRTTRRKAKDEDEYESAGDDDYDYDDPFINDTDEIEEDTDDEDWELTEKDKKREKELEPQLLDDEEWRAVPEDEPEVLELLKEAKDFIRNKKMQRH